MPPAEGLTSRQKVVKRALDLLLGVSALVVMAPLIGAAWLAATAEFRQNGMFWQTRVGRDGTSFHLLKIRTMRGGGGSTVTTARDVRITRFGAFIRRMKIDELPQLVNVIRGEMSLVGPRPDVPGFADELEGRDRIILSVRPGITGPATITFRREEDLLASVPDPEGYNREMIWPEKVRINREYVEAWSLAADTRCLALTLRSVFERSTTMGRSPHRPGVSQAP